MNQNHETASALSAPIVRALPSIFDEDDNVYNTYPLPSEDPRKAHHFAGTNAGTPRARRNRPRAA